METNYDMIVFWIFIIGWRRKNATSKARTDISIKISYSDALRGNDECTNVHFHQLKMKTFQGWKCDFILS